MKFVQVPRETAIARAANVRHIVRMPSSIVSEEYDHWRAIAAEQTMHGNVDAQAARFTNRLDQAAEDLLFGSHVHIWSSMDADRLRAIDRLYVRTCAGVALSKLVRGLRELGVEHSVDDGQEQLDSSGAYSVLMQESQLDADPFQGVIDLQREDSVHDGEAWLEDQATGLYAAARKPVILSRDFMDTLHTTQESERFDPEQMVAVYPFVSIGYLSVRS